MSLYSIVDEYASLGHHRTGTSVDRVTTEWFAAKLESLGARVEVNSFEIAVYRATWGVEIDDEEVPSLPLFYEGVGQYQTTSVARDVLHVDSYDAGFRDLPGIIESARKTNLDALVIATSCANDSIYAINRKPTLASGLPCVLVPGRLSAQLANSRIRMEMHAVIEPGISQNVVGQFGPHGAPAVVVTTPLSGWFGCAGERGTGIAIALSLAQSLGEVMPVELVATSAHELYYEGAWQHTHSVASAPPLVVHIGSSVAATGALAGDGVDTLTPDLEFRTHLERGACGRAGEIMSSLGVSVIAVTHPCNPHSWSGESSCWAQFGGPMISLAGDFPLFHTPEDIPERATTPALLERVDGVLGDAVWAALGS